MWKYVAGTYFHIVEYVALMHIHVECLVLPVPAARTCDFLAQYYVREAHAVVARFI